MIRFRCKNVTLDPIIFDVNHHKIPFDLKQAQIGRKVCFFLGADDTYYSSCFKIKKITQEGDDIFIDVKALRNKAILLVNFMVTE